MLLERLPDGADAGAAIVDRCIEGTRPSQKKAPATITVRA